MDTNSAALASGFAEARAITKKYAKTFYFASGFLNIEKQNAAYSLYALCRVSDEAVDNETPLSAKNSLARLQSTIDSVYSGVQLKENLLLAFRNTVQRYNIPKLYFDELIKGMYMDLDVTRYANFQELYGYCYKVAGVVGLMMLKVFGYTDPRAETYAVNLGLAMQLTNILRDIKEDFARARVYLPQDEMRNYGIADDDLSKALVNDAFKGFMKFQIARARHYYDASRPGIPMIPDAKSRFVVSAMKEMYAGILDAIEHNNFDVFSQRAHVSTSGKISKLLAILMKGKNR